MNRAAWLNAALAAAVIALGAFLYLKPAKEAGIEHSLSALKPEEALSLRVERAGAVPVVFEKRQDTWFLISPLTARADDGRVQQLLSIVQARSSHRLPADDRARFGLEPPQARIVVDGQAFSFGLVNELTREQYVLSGDAVFPVHPRYGMALPATAADAVSRQLFATGEVPVRIESRDFTVFLQDGKWTLAPGAAELSQDDLARWVDEWRLASALRVEPRATTKAQEQIRIQLKSGNPVTIGIIARAPELVLARADEKLQYYFRPELAKRLLSPPGVVGDPPAKR